MSHIVSVATKVRDPLAVNAACQRLRLAPPRQGTAELFSGNATGLTVVFTDLSGKRLELLREILPNLRRLAILTNIDNPGAMLEVNAVRALVRSLGLELVTPDVRRPEDIASAFESLKDRVEAFYVIADPFITTNRIRINTLALRARMPTLHTNREFVEVGGLMSYGPNIMDLFRRAAELVDKILRGAKPGDIPVEQPTKFDLVINLTTARALGLTVPPQLRGHDVYLGQFFPPENSRNA